MKRILSAMGVAFGLLLQPVSQAGQPAAASLDVMSAADLQQLCAGSDHVSINVCRVYILGVTEGVVLGLGLAGNHQARPCLPASVNAESLEATVKRHLGATLNAADSQRDAAHYILKVLNGEFPCGSGHSSSPNGGAH